MNKILILGKGQLGTFYSRYFSKLDYYEVYQEDVDITDTALLEKKIDEIEPDIIINCAAKTNLEWCENNKEEALTQQKT